MSKTAAPPVRTALVTGASSGIGEAFAAELAARGAGLVLVARRAERLERLAARLVTEHGVPVEVLVADLADPDRLAVVERRLADPARPVDLLVNNAGSMCPPSPFWTQPMDAEQSRVAVNVVAVMRLTHAALPGMLRRRDGAVLNVSSIGGFLPLPQGATYAAAKAFVTSFSETVHCEVRHRGVRVTALCPGFTRRGDAVERGGSRRFRMPRPSWLEREDVVRQALAAVAAGQPICVPGRTYRSLLVASRLVPRAVVRRGFERLWAPAP